MIAYKFLTDRRAGPFSGVIWPTDLEWLPASGGDRACSPRVHACRVEDLPEWMNHQLWRVELDGDVRVDCGKLVADRGRLLELIHAWDLEVMVAFAEACALGARDAALTLLPAGAAYDTLASATSAEQLADAAARLADLELDEARAVGYAGDAARHVLGARAEPVRAPTHAAVNGFIGAHAAAFAEDTLAAVGRERAWQAQWLARRLALPAEEPRSPHL